MGEVALSLERDHLGAHGRGGYYEIRVLGDRRRSDRLGGVDVFDDNCFQNGGFARVEVIRGLR